MDILKQAVVELNLIKRLAQLGTQLLLDEVLESIDAESAEPTEPKPAEPEEEPHETEATDTEPTDNISKVKKKPKGTDILESIYLSNTTSANGGTLYWSGVLRFLLHGKTRSGNLGVQKFAHIPLPAYTTLKERVESSMAATNDTLKVHLEPKMLNHVIGMLAVDLDTEFSTHIIGMLDILVEKVLKMGAFTRSMIRQNNAS